MVSVAKDSGSFLIARDEYATYFLPLRLILGWGLGEDSGGGR